MNKVMLIGNLTRDPELASAGRSGVNVCRFGLAVHRRFQNKDGSKEVDFFNISAWRVLGENCAKFIKKGSKVCVLGEIQIRNYDDKEGNKKSVIDIVADEIEFLDKKSDSNNNSTGEFKTPPPKDDGMQPITDDNLPF